MSLNRRNPWQKAAVDSSLMICLKACKRRRPLFIGPPIVMSSSLLIATCLRGYQWQLNVWFALQPVFISRHAKRMSDRGMRSRRGEMGARLGDNQCLQPPCCCHPFFSEKTVRTGALYASLAVLTVVPDMINSNKRGQKGNNIWTSAKGCVQLYNSPNTLYLLGIDTPR